MDLDLSPAIEAGRQAAIEVYRERTGLTPDRADHYVSAYALAAVVAAAPLIEAEARRRARPAHQAEAFSMAARAIDEAAAEHGVTDNLGIRLAVRVLDAFAEEATKGVDHAAQ